MDKAWTSADKKNLMSAKVHALYIQHVFFYPTKAIAQKLGILGEKVSSMTGLRIQKYLLGPI